MNAIEHMTRALAAPSKPPDAPQLVIQYTIKREYRPLGRALRLLLILRDAGQPVPAEDLAVKAGVLTGQVRENLRAAVRMGIVRRVGDAWEWAA